MALFPVHAVSHVVEQRAQANTFREECSQQRHRVAAAELRSSARRSESLPRSRAAVPAWEVATILQLEDSFKLERPEDRSMAPLHCAPELNRPVASTSQVMIE